MDLKAIKCGGCVIIRVQESRIHIHTVYTMNEEEYTMLSVEGFTNPPYLMSVRSSSSRRKKNKPTLVHTLSPPNFLFICNCCKRKRNNKPFRLGLGFLHVCCSKLCGYWRILYRMLHTVYVRFLHFNHHDFSLFSFRVCRFALISNMVV